jgi:hypothetical protein
MKKTAPAFLWVILFLILAHPMTGKSQSESLGLGLILFGPTGFSGRYLSSIDNSFDFALAWDTDDFLYIHGDYLWHKHGLMSEANATMNAHFGAGARLIFADETVREKRRKNRDRFGIRAPLGLNVMFKDPSLELFLEIALVVDFLEDSDIDLHPALGGRFYF